MIVLHASFPIDPEHRDEALDLASTLVEESNEEAGTIEYRAAIDVEDDTVLRFFEQYEDEAAFEAHAASAHFQAFEDRLPELLAGEPTVTQFEVESATELDL
ncbi:putative quinol monooxygenase [Halobellus rufus]|uniref:putative quinol monooxygenase n=1 Tax=Halobellus rufus TaxID=1448860 RepID=UPI0006784BDD|nr:putative quinol monooxygenase [Halobellus rufus]